MSNIEDSSERPYSPNLPRTEIRSEYPLLDEDILDGLPSINGEPLRNIDRAVAQRVWQVEQRLAAINDGRETGHLSAEEADQMELEALRKMRESVLIEGLAVRVEQLHMKVEEKNMPPLNVPRPETRQVIIEFTDPK